MSGALAWEAVMRFQRDLAGCDEDSTWERFGQLADDLLVRDSAWALTYSPAGPRGVVVASRRRDQVGPAPLATARSADDWAQLRCSDGAVRTAQHAGALEVALGLALGVSSASRRRRLTDERHELGREVTARFVHEARNHFAALSSLGGQAFGDEASFIPDRDEFRAAIKGSADDALALLRGVALVPRAANLDERLRGSSKLLQAVAEMGPPDGEVPTDTVIVPFSDELLMEVMTVVSQGLCAPVASWSVREHVDGWAVQLNADHGDAQPVRRVRWAALRGDLGLGLVAVVCNDLGGRTWTDLGENGERLCVGCTFPAL